MAQGLENLLKRAYLNLISTVNSLLISALPWYSNMRRVYFDAKTTASNIIFLVSKLTSANVTFHHLMCLLHLPLNLPL